LCFHGEIIEHLRIFKKKVKASQNCPVKSGLMGQKDSNQREKNPLLDIKVLNLRKKNWQKQIKGPESAILKLSEGKKLSWHKKCYI